MFVGGYHNDLHEICSFRAVKMKQKRRFRWYIQQMIKLTKIKKELNIVSPSYIVKLNDGSTYNH